MTALDALSRENKIDKSQVKAAIDKYKIDSNDRKPNVGMLQSIYQEWNLQKSKMITLIFTREF